MKFPTYQFEQQKISEGFSRIAGCDEVGIGPLAGPVVAAAVVLDPSSIIGRRTGNKWWARIRDSKTVKETEREELANFIQDQGLDSAIGIVEPVVIDEINIHQAAMLAMQKSIEHLQVKPNFIFLDGIYTLKNL